MNKLAAHGWSATPDATLHMRDNHGAVGSKRSNFPTAAYSFARLFLNLDNVARRHRGVERVGPTPAHEIAHVDHEFRLRPSAVLETRLSGRELLFKHRLRMREFTPLTHIVR